MSYEADDRAFGRYIENLWMTAPTPPVPVDQEDAKHAISYDDVPDEAPSAPLLNDPVLDEVFKGHGGIYKIELRLGSNRKSNWITAKIDLWESGRYFAGDGDDHMFICGYPDCMAPIPSDCLEGEWVMCPVCQEKARNHNGLQAASSEAAGYKLDESSFDFIPATKHRMVKTEMGFNVPCVRDCILVAGQPDRIATILARMWNKFGGKADIYLKYHPDDIRHQPGLAAARPVWDKKDVLVIYSMEDILKDVLAGASVDERFKALLKA